MSKILKAVVLISNCILIMSCSSKSTSNIGVVGQKLHPCADTPNCVSSFDERSKFYIKPLNSDLNKIEHYIAKQPRTKIITKDKNYLHVEFKSLIFRFIDDVEFLFDPNSEITNVRSASRVGKSDLGVNRKRIEKIRNYLEEMSNSDK